MVPRSVCGRGAGVPRAHGDVRQLMRAIEPFRRVHALVGRAGERARVPESIAHRARRGERVLLVRARVDPPLGRVVNLHETLVRLSQPNVKVVQLVVTPARRATRFVRA